MKENRISNGIKTPIPTLTKPGEHIHVRDLKQLLRIVNTGLTHLGKPLTFEEMMSHTNVVLPACLASKEWREVIPDGVEENHHTAVSLLVSGEAPTVQAACETAIVERVPTRDNNFTPYLFSLAYTKHDSEGRSRIVASRYIINKMCGEPGHILNLGVSFVENENGISDLISQSVPTNLTNLYTHSGLITEAMVEKTGMHLISGAHVDDHFYPRTLSSSHSRRDMFVFDIEGEYASVSCLQPPWGIQVDRRLRVLHQ